MVTAIYRSGGTFPQGAANTAYVADGCLVMPEPKGLIRIDWWGQKFPTANVGTEEYSGECQVSIGGAVWKGKADFKIQGSSTAAHPKKNQTLKLRDSSGKRLAMKIGDSPAIKKWTWKAEYTDSSKVSNFISYRLYEQIVNSRHTLPKNEVDYWWWNNTNDAPEGQPTGASGYPRVYQAVMYHNDEFYGIGFLIIKGDLANFNVFEEDYEAGAMYMEFDGRGADIKDPDGNVTPLKSWRRFYAESPRIVKNESAGWTQQNIDVVNNAYSVINGTQQNFDANWDSVFDKRNLIDFYLFIEFIYDWDGVAQDLDIVTYGDGILRFFPYDKDTTFGVYWTDREELRPPTTILVKKNTAAESKRLWKRVRNAWDADVNDRYAELRKNGIFSQENIADLGRLCLAAFTREMIEADFEKWPDTFFRENNLVRVIDWIGQRIAVLDAEFEYVE